VNLEHAINAAARTHWETWWTAVPPEPVRRWDHLSDTERDEVRALVRPIVEAAAPWIAQTTLRSEAWAFRGIEGYSGFTVQAKLNARADEIQAVTR